MCIIQDDDEKASNFWCLDFTSFMRQAVYEKEQ